MSPRLVAALVALGLSGAIFVAARRYRPDDAPFHPRDDREILERIGGGAAAPDELRGLEARLARAPEDVALAVEVARRHVETARTTGDARRLGYAEAALAPFASGETPPIPVRLLRATIHRRRQALEAALADLDAVTRLQPDDPQAWIDRAAIFTSLARYDEAKVSCAHARGLVAASCAALPEALSGGAGAARVRLSAAIDGPGAPPDELRRARALRAEIALYFGDPALAERDLRAVLAAAPEEVEARGLLCDLLLDAGRPAEVLSLVTSDEPNEALVLRRAIAARASGAPDATALRARLASYATELAARGDATQLGDEARRLLVLEDRPGDALEAAVRGYARRREPWDARILLEAAAALARDPARAAEARAAAAPALAWQARARLTWPPFVAAAAALESAP